MLKISAALATVFCAALLTGCASLSPTPWREGRAEFVVIGDTPYNETDEAMLKVAVPKIKALRPSFVLHVGDTQSGGQMCGPPDDAFAALIETLKPIPLIYAIGDNETSDCDRKTDPATGQKFSELQRLEVIRKRFFAVPAMRGRDYAQQPGAPENARFVYRGLVFATLNVSGTNNGRDFVMGDPLQVALKAAEAHDADQVAWLNAAFDYAEQKRLRGVVIVMQADMANIKPAAAGKACTDVSIDDSRLCDGYFKLRQALIARSEVYKKPIFVIHGDTDPFTLTRGFDGHATDRLWVLNAAGDAGTDKDGKPYGVHDVTHVWIDLSRPDMLRAQGLTTGLKPDTAAAAKK